MNRGEVWWAESPSQKRRPYLVLSRERAIPVLSAVVGVPATRTIRGIPTEVRLDEDDGMPADCALNFDNLATIPKAWLVERICRLGPQRLHEVPSVRGTACFVTTTRPT